MHAWQVEVAAGKLVMAASKLMCKELGVLARDADCARRQQTRSLLCDTSEAVGVKSSERATTEQRTELDTPALAEALKTTARKLQIAEQRVATLEASLTRQQNLRMHGELSRAIDIPAGGAAANHSYKKVFMQYCGAEREATLREPWCRICDSLCANWSSIAKCGSCTIVPHLRSESQLDQLEPLKVDQQRIEIEFQFNASLHEREFVLGSTHVVVCDRGLVMYTKMRRGMRRTRQCRVLYFEVHGDFNAADRAANAPVSAPVTPPVRGQEGRPAPRLPERGQRQSVVHAKVELEREPKSCLQ